MTELTEGIILRTIPYGDTSLVVHAFTRKYGIVALMMKGARKMVKSGRRADILQPGSILNLSIYYKPHLQMYLLQDAQWSYVNAGNAGNVVRSAVKLYCLEMLYNSLSERECLEPVYEMAREAIIWTDRVENKKALAVFPLFYALRLAALLGFEPENNYNGRNFLHLALGRFEDSYAGMDVLDAGYSAAFSKLLEGGGPEEFAEAKLSREERRNLLVYIDRFYSYHVPAYRPLKSLAILAQII